MSWPAAVLITGVSGNLGAKLAAPLAGRTRLVLLDHQPRDGIHRTDLSRWGDWIEHFRSVEAVVHLAGDPVAYLAQRLRAPGDRLPEHAGCQPIGIIEILGNQSLSRWDTREAVVSRGRHPGGRGTTVPFHKGRDISPVLLRKIARDIGMTPEEFVSALPGPPQPAEG